MFLEGFGRPRERRSYGGCALREHSVATPGRSQELKKVELAVQSSGHTAEHPAVADAKRLVAAAEVTKVSAVLLHHFASVTEAGPLRSKCQSEIRELRSYRLQESEVLHPAIMRRLTAALAMR